MKRNLRRAFTIIELLTVMAISAVLLGIIVIPLVQSFNFSRAAMGFADAQQKARELIESVSREIDNSAGVRSTEGIGGQIAVVVPAKDGTQVSIMLQNSKLDILKPSQGDPPTGPGFVNPDNGHVDPTLKGPRGQITLPAAPGSTMVRYFIGLRKPLAADGLTAARYANPYDGILMPIAGGGDNLYVLYRGVVQPSVFNGTKFVPNDKLFDVVNDANGNPTPVLDDPFFFVQDPPGVTMTALQRSTRAKHIKNWLAASTIVTQDTRFDMIQPLFNRATHEPEREADGNTPKLMSLISFRPTPVTDEPAIGQTALRPGEETDVPPGSASSTNPNGIAPDVFRTTKGNWDSAVVKVQFNSGTNPPTASSDLLVADLRASTPVASRLRILRGSDGLELFDIAEFKRFVSQGYVYPFSHAVDVSNARSGFLAQQSARDNFIPFLVESNGGAVVSSFGIDQVGIEDPANPSRVVRADNNLPSQPTCGPDNIAYTPMNDPNVGTGTFSDSQFSSINERFNKVYTDHPELRPNIHRFIDLRITPQADGLASPMDPSTDGAAGGTLWASGWTGFNQIHLVPNSEVVIGPDQNPGQNYGQAIRYVRTTQNPGPNQYKINYINLLEPTDYSQIDPGLSNPLATYSATDFSTAVIQPRYKAGYIQFDSDPNVPIPFGTVSVYYKFQFNRPGDTITVDYDTREVMNILLTIRNYPQTTLPNPQTITVKGTAPIRNFLR